MTPAPDHSPRRPRRPRRVLTVVLVATLTFSVGALAGPATADRGHQRPDGAAGEQRRGPGDGSQPLPGYTVSNPPLDPLTVDGEQTRVEQGVRDHAAYTIEVPPDWNGELVLWAHGYRGTGKTLTVDPPAYGLRQKLVEEGYAWAASSYARNGYDVATGVTTTRSLARFTARQVLPRRPGRTYVAGVSMGGHVIGRSLEQYPRFYDGALPMCGVLGDQELFDYFLGYNLVAQELAGVDAYPFPTGYQTEVVPTIKERLGLGGGVGDPVTDPEGAQLVEVTTDLSGGPRPGAEAAFTVWKDFLFTLGSPDTGGPLALNPGRIAQNLDVTYRPSAPVDVDATVERVAPADRRARRTHSLTAIPKIEGRPKVPTLTLHGLGDLFVPFSMEQVYRREVERRKQGNLLVQRAIRAAGHCEFTAGEVGTAWEDLTDWVESRDAVPGNGRGNGKGRGQGRGAAAVDRPAGDDVLDPAEVASPTYGCQFTDPAGRGAEATPTRVLYPPCPED